MISLGLEISYELGNSLDHGQVKGNLLPPLISRICGELSPPPPIQTLKYSKLQHKLQLAESWRPAKPKDPQLSKATFKKT